MVMRSIVPDKGAQSAWQIARRSEIRMPCIILVNPFVDGNVGSVSRCMLNWGLSELRIGDESHHVFVVSRLPSTALKTIPMRKE